MRKEDISTPQHRLARRWLRTVNEAVQSAAWEAGALRTRTGSPARPKEVGLWELGIREASVSGGVPHPAGQGQWPEPHRSRLLHSAHKLPRSMTPSPPTPLEMAQSHEQHEVPAGPSRPSLRHTSRILCLLGLWREVLGGSAPFWSLPNSHTRDADSN